MNETDHSRLHGPSESPRASAEQANELTRLQRSLLCIFVLIPLFVVIYFLSFWLRTEGKLSSDQWIAFLLTVTGVVMLKMMVFLWFRVHHILGRYVTFQDLITLFWAATVNQLVLAVIIYYLLQLDSIPRSVLPLDWLLTIMAVGGLLAVLRVLHENNWPPFAFFSKKKVPTLIVGANEAGESLLYAIVRNRKMPYHVVGFIDEDPERVGTRIGSSRVLGTLPETCQIAAHYGVNEILITTGGLSGRQVRRLVDEARQRQMQVKVLPSFEELISGRLAVQPRPVAIEDLLRREPVKLELDNIRQWIDNRVLLVTGSAGSIGSEICRQLLQFSPKRLIMLDRWETGQFYLEQELNRQRRDVQIDVQIADLLNEKRVREILESCRPDIIFHAAAYKHVPLMEKHPCEALRNIVLATRTLANLAMQCKVDSFVMVSTDKAVNPTNVMGACKRVAELYVQSLAGQSSCRFVTVRFGNVLDSSGSVVPIFRQQIARGGPVTVTDPGIVRYFMTIPEASRLVIQAGIIGNGGEILVLDMGEPMRIVDLATDMIRLSGLEVGRDVEIVFIGLRPGEKLFEELHYADAKYLPTRHPKILVLGGGRRDPKELHASVDRLLNLGDDDPWLIVNHLRKLVPEYKPGVTSPYADKASPLTADSHETPIETAPKSPLPLGEG
ncbi:MAG: nucleoside-diphosphate sugar epimerase/dehydratase [Thermoguttaceae bacterium]